MKRIYSIVLMATALFIGTNVWATTRTASTAGEFEDAWKAAVDGDIIQLTESFSVSGKTFWLGSNAMNGAYKSITLDLNGKVLTASNNSSTTKLFVVSHGELKVITSQAGGQIIHDGASSSSSYEIFRVMGSTYKNIDPSKEDITYYSHLVIGNGVTLNAKANGVVIDYATWSGWSTNYVATKDAGSKPSYDTNVYTTARGTANGARVDIYGTIYAHKYGVKANGNMGSPDTKPTARPGYWADPEQSIAYEVLASDIQYSPYIYIHNGAILETLDKSETYAIAAYSGGYSRWMIEGTCVGSTGVYVKSGQLTINNATVASNYNGDYEPAVQDRTSGVDAAGSGIVMESATAYAGGIDVTVSGNTTVTPTSGYAVDESITQKSGTGESKVDGITIEGGTFKEGGEGTISITQTTAGTGESSTQKVEISGGTIDAGTSTTPAVSIGGQTLQEFLTGQTDDTHAVVVETDEQGNQTIVVSEGTAPVEANSVIATADGGSCNWTSVADAEETLIADKTLTELQITSANYNQKLIVSDGVTLSVGRVVMGAKAQIVVKPGAKLIITGEQGLAAFQESNIVLQNENGKRSIFLFNPAVTSNTHPMATVELITNSWRNGAGDLQWEILGLPTYEAATSIDKDGAAPIAISVWENGAWSSLGIVGSTSIDLSKLDKSFAPYDLLANRKKDEAAPKLIIGGKLVGNMNGSLYANYRWTPFANSYTGEMDLKAFLTALGGAQSIAQGIWIAQQQGLKHLAWNALDLQEVLDGDADILKLEPMQAFMLNNPGNINEYAALDYASTVWGPATTPASPAPSRFAASETTAKVRVLVTDEQGIVDKVMVRENASNVYALEKYLNEDMNIYVLAGEKNAIVNAENLENTYVGFSTIKGGKFTISFANVAGRELTLIDHETGERVAMVEGNAYEFTADANSVNDYRFEIVASAKVPTAIENAEAVKSAKGIYTITGQYMGEMNVWNSLPAGIYVVNGEKRVK